MESLVITGTRKQEIDLMKDHSQPIFIFKGIGKIKRARPD
jgi:hypothetical protein